MKRPPIRPRVILAIAVGIAIGISITYLLENDILAAVLVALAALAAADLTGVLQYATVGLVTGAAVGLFIAATGEPLAGGSLLPAGPWRVIASLLASAVVSGLVGASYGFMMARLKRLHDEGRGPFF